MISITLKGREIPLLYTVWEMKQVQEEICPLGELSYAAFGRNKEDKNDTSKYGSPEHLNALAKLVKILGNAGLEEAGENPDLTEKKILRMMRIDEIAQVENACVDAMNEAMASEIPEKKEEGPVDVTLEEIEKKKERDG